MKSIYLDNCCMSRLTDELSALRVFTEANAVEFLLTKVAVNELHWVASTINLAEIERIEKPIKRGESLALLDRAGPLHNPTDAAVARGKFLHNLGYGKQDAMHMACAEESGVSVLLTTDDAFQGLAERGIGGPRVTVENPVRWVGIHYPKEIGDDSAGEDRADDR